MGKSLPSSARYVWTVRDVEEWSGRLQPASGCGYTVYGLMRSEVGGPHKAGDLVTLKLPGRAAPFRSIRFFRVRQSRLRWYKIGADANVPEVAAARTLADLFDALHRKYPEKYPARFYRFGREYQKTSSVYQLISQDRHLAIVFDHHKNGKYRAACVANGAATGFSWSSYWPNTQTKRWQGIFEVPCPPNKSTVVTGKDGASWRVPSKAELWVPQTPRRRKHLSAAASNRTRAAQWKESRKVFSWASDIDNAVTAFKDAADDFVVENERRAGPIAMMELLDSVLDFERVSVVDPLADPTAGGSGSAPAPPDNAEEDATVQQIRNKIGAVVTEMRGWDGLVPGRAPGERATVAVDSLNRLLFDDKEAADALAGHLNRGRTNSGPLARAADACADALHLMSWFPMHCHIDAGDLFAAIDAGSQMAGGDSEPTVAVGTEVSPLKVLLSYAPSGSVWRRYKRMKSVPRAVKTIRRLLQLADYAGAVVTGQALIASLKRTPIISDVATLSYASKARFRGYSGAASAATAAAATDIRSVQSAIAKMSPLAFQKRLELLWEMGDTKNSDLDFFKQFKAAVETEDIVTRGKLLDKLLDKYPDKVRDIGALSQARPRGAVRRLLQRSGAYASAFEPLFFWVGSALSLASNLETTSARREMASKHFVLYIAGLGRRGKVLSEVAVMADRVFRQRMLLWANGVHNAGTLTRGVAGLLKVAPKLIPCVNHAVSALIDFSYAYYHIVEKGETMKGVGYLVSGAGNTCIALSIFVNSSWLGPAGWCLMALGGSIILFTDSVEQETLKPFSEAVVRLMEDAANSDIGYYYQREASEAMKEEVSEIVQLMAKLAKLRPRIQTDQQLRMRGVPESVFHLVVSGYEKPLLRKKKRQDTTTPASERGVGYWKQGGEWSM